MALDTTMLQVRICYILWSFHAERLSLCLGCPVLIKATLRPFTLSVNVCVCIFENNEGNGNKMQIQRMVSVPIPSVNVQIDTMLKV